jgi:addiction module HigA family antidote
MTNERQRYEYTPDRVSPPGESLIEILQDRGLSQASLAARTGRPRKTINEIIKGKAPITPSTALQLERVLGVPASFWNNLEKNYRQYLAHAEESERLSKARDWLKHFPIKEMANRGWIPRCKEPVGTIRALLDFFGLAAPDQWEVIAEQADARFRQSHPFESDKWAVLAWLRKGAIEAEATPCAAFSKAGFRESLERVRRLTAQHPTDAIDQTRCLCAEFGVAVVLVPELPKCRLAGAASWLNSEKAILQLSDRYKKDDQFWFAFFHEAAHILKHSKKSIFLDGADRRSNKEEEEADHFAADILVPPKDWRKIEAWPRYTKASISSEADRLGIAPGILVGRLQHEQRLPHSHLNGLKRAICFTGRASGKGNHAGSR